MTNKQYQAALRGEIILMTAKGQQAIHDRLEVLRVEKAELERRLGLDAADYPDLRENATYGDLSMKIQLELPRQVDDLRQMLEKAVVAPIAAASAAHLKLTFDTRFTAVINQSVPTEFWLAGPTEITLLEAPSDVQPVSYLSPLGRAVWGAKLGSVVSFEIDGATRTVEITQIA